MPFMTIRGIRTYYETHGEGESLVLLHNGFSCAMMWDILYDRRGYGRSEEGPDFEGYYTGPRFREESVAAMEELLDILGIGDFHIVGQCEGGVVGVDFTLAHPHRVRTLTMASTLCFSKTSMEIFPTKICPVARTGTRRGLFQPLQPVRRRLRPGRLRPTAAAG
ncbi:MAG: alpha/beta hydrolase [Deltaproteobacteria bacterium]|nr:alpha/beta hydrolase [Deltaproteobacteria bacterium]